MFEEEDTLGGRGFCGVIVQHDLLNNTKREHKIYVGDDFFVGRDSRCDISSDDPTISYHHLRIYVIGFDELKPDIAPLVYAEDTSKNGTILIRTEDVTDPGMETSSKTLTNEGPAYLLSHGDELHLSPRVLLQFHLQSSGRVPISMREQIRGPEKKLFKHLYSVTRRKIGEGGFGEVFLAFDRRTGVQLACKVIDVHALQNLAQDRKKHPDRRSGEKPYTHIKLEVEILAELNHPNILSIESVFWSKSTAYIFTELVTAGDLMSYVQHRGGRLDDCGTAIIVRQIVKAIQFLESKNITHRDLKPENILMTSLTEGARIIVSDFGHARYLPGFDESALKLKIQTKPKRMTSVVGTLEYAAPEMYTSYGVITRTNPGYSNAIDMWSIGTITALLLSGRQPFGLDDDSQLPEHEREKRIRVNAQKRNLRALESSEYWQKVGPRAKDFVMKLLVVDEEQRMTADQAAEHPWFSHDKYRKQFNELYERATAGWRPRPAGKALLKDLDVERRNQIRNAILASSLDTISEDELSQGHESGVSKSKYF